MNRDINELMITAQRESITGLRTIITMKDDYIAHLKKTIIMQVELIETMRLLGELLKAENEAYKKLTTHD